ncbi:hypothetical protein GCM10010313_75290 [Streptomyces violarus]|nr:hypothetical protein GCM10010313_75290 [Streptomyces violarus]
MVCVTGSAAFAEADAPAAAKLRMPPVTPARTAIVEVALRRGFRWLRM